MTFRVRRMANGDMTFGHGENDFLIDSPAAVAQLIQTRLLLWEGEWYLDLSEGTPYMQTILGNSVSNARDAAIQDRILQTPFVAGLSNYSSSVDPTSRALTVSAVVTTAFGTIPGPSSANGMLGPARFTVAVTPLGPGGGGLGVSP